MAARGKSVLEFFVEKLEMEFIDSGAQTSDEELFKF